MKSLTAAGRRQLNAAFAKEIASLVAAWKRESCGNTWADEARAVAEGVLLKLAQTGELTPDADGDYPLTLRRRACRAMRHAVHAELVPLAHPLSASVNAHAAYRKARATFERAHPECEFHTASVSTIAATLGCTRAFAFRARAACQPRLPSAASEDLARRDDAPADPAGALAEAERHHALHAALLALPADKRALLARLYGLDGGDARPIAELARERGISRQSLAEQLARVIARLRTALTPYAILV